jgi:hypothetical protein
MTSRVGIDSWRVDAGETPSMNLLSCLYWQWARDNMPNQARIDRDMVEELTKRAYLAGVKAAQSNR